MGPVPIFSNAPLYAGAMMSSPNECVPSPKPVATSSAHSSAQLPSSAEVVVVGAGPTGSAAAIHAARAGLDVVLLDSQVFPRDKTCGDGLTPRAIAELRRLGLADAILGRTRNRGLKLHGFGGSITALWPSGPFPSEGSAMPRTELDAFLLDTAREAGAKVFDGVPVVGVERGSISKAGAGAGVPGITGVSVKPGDETSTHHIRTRWLLVADGVRSVVGKQLGRTWHRDSVFGVAARSYVDVRADASAGADDEWIHSHLELRGADGQTHPGYGWIFPLGDGRANLGCGALATASRPARANVKKLLRDYHGQVRGAWSMGEPEMVTSALLPMGGAVSNVAGSNWALLGDAACLVNPLNGEGIDYGMESARLAVELIGAIGAGRDGLTHAWPALLQRHYGEGFSLARKLALTLTYPKFLPAVGPMTIGAPWGEPLMGVAARLMGNLVAEEDRDVVARVWKAAGRASLGIDGIAGRKPWA